MASKTRTTQQKKAKEQKRNEKAQRKREQRVQKKLDPQKAEEGEMKLLDGPVYFTDFDPEDIRI